MNGERQGKRSDTNVGWVTLAAPQAVVYINSNEKTRKREGNVHVQGA